MVQCGPDYDPEKSREIAQGVYTAIKKSGIDPCNNNRWKMENTCIDTDLGVDSLGFIELGIEIEEVLDIIFPVGTEASYWDAGKTSVLDTLKMSYENKHNHTL